MIISAVDGAHYASAPPTFQLRSYIAPVMTESGEEVDENINEAKSIVNLVNNASGSSGNVPGTPIHAPKQYLYQMSVYIYCIKLDA